MDSNVVPLFPTPLYTTNVPEELIEDHIDLLDSEELSFHDNNMYGARSQNTYILDQKEYKKLGSFILHHCFLFGSNYLSFDYNNYRFTQSWVSEKKLDDEHKVHTHPNSLISGVLFYQQSTLAPPILFHKYDSMDSFYILPKFKDELNPFSSKTYQVPYKPNLLLLFPSYLNHSVPKNTHATPRKSLAFNIVPKRGFGDETDLTELIF